MPANMTRAHRGIDLVESYFHDREDSPIEHRDDYRGAAIDVMVDVLHALHRWGWDAEDAHAMALRHFTAEKVAEHPATSGFTTTGEWESA